MGEGVRLSGRMCTGDGGQASCGRPHRILKLESTDVILSSSNAKKLVSFYQNFVFGQNKVDIFRWYKLLIKIINSTVLNKSQSCSFRSGHCTCSLLAVSWERCVFHVVHKGEVGLAHVDACGQGRGVKNRIFCGRHKWMTPIFVIQPAWKTHVVGD